MRLGWVYGCRGHFIKFKFNINCIKYKLNSRNFFIIICKTHIDPIARLATMTIVDN